MPSQSSPTSESPHDMWAERSILNGMFLGAVAYGTPILLYPANLLSGGAGAHRHTRYTLCHSTPAPLLQTEEKSRLHFPRVVHLHQLYPGYHRKCSRHKDPRGDGIH